MTVENQTPPPGTGQCQVTGKIVPEDELVTFQGQRVCAEGKAILIERLQSGEAMPGELIRPTVMRRFGASVLDGLVVVLPLLIGVGLVVGAAVATGGSGTVSPFVVGSVSVLGTLLLTSYYALMHARRGQTVGKIAAKLKVVNDADGSPITPATAWLRAAVYVGPNLINDFANFTGSQALIGVASLLVSGWGIANVVVALVDRDRQRALHDKIAGTRVIQTEL